MDDLLVEVGNVKLTIMAIAERTCDASQQRRTSPFSATSPILLYVNGRAAAAQVALILGVALAATGCGNEDGLSPEETDLRPCPVPTGLPEVGAEEVDLLPSVQISDLPTRAPVKCDMADWAIVFPSNSRFEIGDIGTDHVVESADGDWVAWTNLGTLGVVASTATNKSDQRWWGTPEGIDKVDESEVFKPPF